MLKTITSRVIAERPAKPDNAAMTTAMTTHNAFGQLLKCWRTRRKHSQLDLALCANVSQRHLSFMESGRAKPSRDMILQLAEVLEIPLRERNILLNAGGYASIYQSRSLNSDEMRAVRQALEMTLAHHEPYPAIVLDKHWNMLLANQAATRFIALLGEPETVWSQVDPSGQYNTMRLTFSPHGMQPLIANWPEVAGMMLERLQREVNADPGNTAQAQLLAELQALPSVTEHANTQAILTAHEPILALDLALGSQTLRIFSMLSTFGTALDITADELRVETFFPADAFSREFFLSLSNATDS